MRRPPRMPIRMWLYPIASSTKFLVRGRTSKGSGAAGFAEMIDRDAGDDVWPISKNFRNVVVGDEIVVYATTTSITPPRLIGSGAIQDGPREVAGEELLHIEIAWNIAVCRRLARDPIDATWLSAKLPVTKPTVTAIPAPLWPRLRDLLANGVPASSMGADIEQVLATLTLSKTVRQQLVDARLGQGLFKTNVARIERGCRLTGVTDRAHLGASHIKPWRDEPRAARREQRVTARAPRRPPVRPRPHHVRSPRSGSDLAAARVGGARRVGAHQQAQRRQVFQAAGAISSTTARRSSRPSRRGSG